MLMASEHRDGEGGVYLILRAPVYSVIVTWSVALVGCLAIWAALIAAVISWWG